MFNFNSSTHNSVQISHHELKIDQEKNISDHPTIHHQDQQEQQQKLHDAELEEDHDEDEEEFEFTFARIKPNGSLISADDIFSNGEIRPIFPLFNRDLLDSNSDDVRAGEYCEWTGKAAEASPEMCKKCNSTGFSKLWRFRDLLHRSNSDGKEKFVFLQLTTKSKKVVSEVLTEKLNGGERNNGSASKVKSKGKKGETALSAHYERNRAIKEGNKRRSYLPYRQDLVGFFTNAHSLSRNVHPY